MKCPTHRACDWGDAPDGIQYFEAQPASAAHKVLFVRVARTSRCSTKEPASVAAAVTPAFAAQGDCANSFRIGELSQMFNVNNVAILPTPRCDPGPQSNRCIFIARDIECTYVPSSRTSADPCARRSGCARARQRHPVRRRI